MATQRDTLWEKLNVDNAHWFTRKQENWIKEKQNWPKKRTRLQAIKTMWKGGKYHPDKSKLTEQK